MFSFSQLRALRWSRGSVLRAAVDIGAIWVAFLFGWIVIEQNPLELLLDLQSTRWVPYVSAFSILAFLAYGASGLYTTARTYTLGDKIRRIVSVNAIFFVLAGSISSFTEPLTPFKMRLFFATFFGSTVLLCAIRTATDILWREYTADAVKKSDARSADEKKVLVIGGGGYIGSALIGRLLGDGFEVLLLDALHFGEQAISEVIDHPKLHLLREDFRNVAVLVRAMRGVGSVVHLGGLVGDPACAVDESLTIDVNVTATKIIGEIAKAHGVRRFVFASSCSVYGSSDEIVNENSSFNPQSLYAKSKVASEVVLNALADDNFSVTNLRFATIYGISGRTRFDLVVNLLCAKAVRDGLITVYGSDQWRPFVHVDDVARAVFMVLTAPKEVVSGEAFNVGSDAENFTLGQIAELIHRQVPNAKIVADETFVDKRNYRVSFEKIADAIGFMPSWSIEAGISQVIDVVRSDRVGHYASPQYSNVLYLKALGAGNFSQTKITGWENDLMNVVDIGSGAAVYAQVV
jgi:nucleoside-diphosphate-sugar epimerase